MSKSKKKANNIKFDKYIGGIIAIIIAMLTGITLSVNFENGKWTASIQYKGED